jgi:hypothetical protein
MKETKKAKGIIDTTQMTYNRLGIIVWVDFDFKDVARLLGVVFGHGLLVHAESDLETLGVYETWKIIQ